MRDISSKQNWPLWTLFVVLSIITIGYFVLRVLITNVKDLNTSVGAINVENTQLEEKLSTLNSLKQEFNDNPDKVKILELAVPEDNMLAEITESLRQIAADSVINITSIKQSNTQSSKNTDVIIELSFEGSYKSFTSFMSNLEKNVRLNTPTKITLNSATNTSGGEVYVKGSMTLDFFKTNTSKKTSTSGSTATTTTNVTTTSTAEATK